MQQLVSIIIPAYNEEKVIGRLLTSIKKQSYPNIEIIVVDDSSSDKTAQIAKKYTTKVFTRSHAERSVQRNFGAEKAKGKYLFFIDADMEFSKNVVTECVEKMSKRKMIGAVVVPEESVATTFWEKVKAFERSFYNLEGDVNTDAARFFAREAFEKAGGYDETITGPEDWDLPETVKKIGYNEERINAIIYHHERIKGPFAIAKKKYYYALKAHRYLKKQGVSTMSAKTVYFLRPVFYKHWHKFFNHPILSLGMVFMLTCELFLGGFGFLLGKLLNK